MKALELSKSTRDRLAELRALSEEAESGAKGAAKRSGRPFAKVPARS